MNNLSCATFPGRNNADPARPSVVIRQYRTRWPAGWAGFAIGCAVVVGRPSVGTAVSAADVPAADATRAPVALQVGERLSFEGRWLGIPVGYGWIEVRELTKLAGHPVYHIEAQGYSNQLLSTFYPVRDVLHSYLDAATLRPMRFEKSQREGRYRAEEVVTFDYQRLTATYRSLLNGSVKEIAIEPDTHDIISSFYRLRTRPDQLLRSSRMSVYSDEKLYRLEVRALGSQVLELRRSVFSCLVVEPVANFKGVFVRRGRLVAYMMADAPHIPLLVKISTPWGLMTGIIDQASLPKKAGAGQAPVPAKLDATRAAASS